MSSVTSETPSSRALKQLSNRNNVADLYLRKRLEQMEREKNFYMSYLDKDRLDVTDFLKNLHKCESDDLPQSKMIREAFDSDDDLSDDTNYVRLRRDTHTAKTAPSCLYPRRHKTHDDNDEDEDDNSLVEHHPRRHIKTSVPTRRQMLAQKRQEERKARESKYEKTEVFLKKLRQDAAKEVMDDVAAHVTRKEFTAYLLKKIRVSGFSTYTWSDFEEGRGEEDEEVAGEESWARARMDMVYPIRRLGNIASRFQKHDSGRNTPGGGLGKNGRWLPSPTKKSANWDRGGNNYRDDMSEAEVSRAAERNPRLPSVFDITEDDPPASILPRPAGMPDFNRKRRDTLVDTARAFGFGEAAVVATSKASPSPQASSPTVGVSMPANPFSRTAIAERRRLERQAKMKPPWHSSIAAKHQPNQKDDPHGTEIIRALMHIKSRFKAKPLDDRIKQFMRDLDDHEKTQTSRFRQESN